MRFDYALVYVSIHLEIDMQLDIVHKICSLVLISFLTSILKLAAIRLNFPWIF